MKLLKNQKGFNDTIVVIILAGILGSLFITGVFIWQEIKRYKEPVVIVVEKIIKVDNSGNETEERQELSKDVLTGQNYLDCEISGGDWIKGDICGVSYTCEAKYNQSKNPVWGSCPLSSEDTWVNYCECGQGFCWDGESCINYPNYKANREN